MTQGEEFYDTLKKKRRTIFLEHKWNIYCACHTRVALKTFQRELD